MMNYLGIIDDQFSIKAFVPVGPGGKGNIMDGAVIFNLGPGLPPGDHASGHAGFNQPAGYFAKFIPGYMLCF